MSQKGAAAMQNALASIHWLPQHVSSRCSSRRYSWLADLWSPAPM